MTPSSHTNTEIQMGKIILIEKYTQHKVIKLDKSIFVSLSFLYMYIRDCGFLWKLSTI